MNKILTEPNEWQKVDDRNGLLFGWYTNNFLDELKKWDVSNWDVLELGCGASTLWWGKMCKYLDSYENNKDWYDIVKEGLNELKLNVNFSFADDFVSVLNTGKKYDCIIVDGDYRTECMKAINENNLKKGGIVILDNFEYIPEIQEHYLYRTNKMFVYPQDNHYFWRTAYWTIENFEDISDNHELNSKKQKERLCK